MIVPREPGQPMIDVSGYGWGARIEFPEGTRLAVGEPFVVVVLGERIEVVADEALVLRGTA